MTTAVIHQPNYLPGCTYFDKIARADVFILLDTVQFIKRNWINRNRVKTVDGPVWLTVPVTTKGRYTQSILDSEIDTASGWQRRHRATIELNYRRAPYWDQYGPVLLAELEKPWTSLAAMNEALLRMLTGFLGIETPFVRASDLAVEGSSTALLVNLCMAAGAGIYLSGPGGRKYIDEGSFRRNGMELVFQEYQHPTYRQLHGAFEPNLSVIDLLFNVGPDSLATLTGATPAEQSAQLRDAYKDDARSQSTVGRDTPSPQFCPTSTSLPRHGPTTPGHGGEATGEQGKLAETEHPALRFGDGTAVHTPAGCEFSAEHYRTFLQRAVEQGYRVQSLGAYYQNQHTPTVIIRHDIDVSLAIALEMARLEVEIGASSSIFVRVHAAGYNPFSRENYDRLQWLTAHDFDIGLHHEVGIFPLEGQPREQLARELRVLEAILDRPVRSIAMHLPRHSRFALSALDLRENGIDYEAGDVVFNEGATFVSDSNRTLKPACPCALLGLTGKIYAQIHPVWWMCSAGEAQDLCRGLVLGK